MGDFWGGVAKTAGPAYERASARRIRAEERAEDRKYADDIRDKQREQQLEDRMKLWRREDAQLRIQREQALQDRADALAAGNAAKAQEAEAIIQSLDREIREKVQPQPPPLLGGPAMGKPGALSIANQEWPEQDGYPHPFEGSPEIMEDIRKSLSAEKGEISLASKIAAAKKGERLQQAADVVSAQKGKLAAVHEHEIEKALPEVERIANNLMGEEQFKAYKEGSPNWKKELGSQVPMWRKLALDVSSFEAHRDELKEYAPKEAEDFPLERDALGRINIVAPDGRLVSRPEDVTAQLPKLVARVEAHRAVANDKLGEGKVHRERALVVRANLALPMDAPDEAVRAALAAASTSTSKLPYKFVYKRHPLTFAVTDVAIEPLAGADMTKENMERARRQRANILGMLAVPDFEPDMAPVAPPLPEKDKAIPAPVAPPLPGAGKAMPKVGEGPVPKAITVNIETTVFDDNPTKNAEIKKILLANPEGVPFEANGMTWIRTGNVLEEQPK